MNATHDPATIPNPVRRGSVLPMIARAVVAGVIGGTIVDLFLIAVRAVPFPGVYQFIASNLVGAVAFTSSSYIALGLAIHFFISIVFALTYTLVAERWRALIEHPTLWGSIFGVAVMIVMQIVLGIGHASKPPTVMGIIMGLISHVVFFGLPVAWSIALAAKGKRPRLNLNLTCAAAARPKRRKKGI